MRKTLLLIACSFLLLNGCDRGGDGAETGQPERTQPTAPTPEQERASWQRPEELIALMGDQLRGRTVADLFAGDGYFTFRLVDAGARVIAIDTDPANIAALEERKKELGLTDQQLTIRHVQPGEPGLQIAEADAAVIVHAYGSIPNRPQYFTTLRQGLRDTKPVFIVDWQYRQTPVGPPMSERIPFERFMEELGAYGFSGVGAWADKMPYQVIMLASDPFDDEMM